MYRVGRHSCSTLRSPQIIVQNQFFNQLIKLFILLLFGSYQRIFMTLALGKSLLQFIKNIVTSLPQYFHHEKQKRWEKMLGPLLIILFAMAIRLGKALHFIQSYSTYLVDKICSGPKQILRDIDLYLNL